MFRVPGFRWLCARRQWFGRPYLADLIILTSLLLRLLSPARALRVGRLCGRRMGHRLFGRRRGDVVRHISQCEDGDAGDEQRNGYGERDPDRSRTLNQNRPGPGNTALRD